MLRLNCLYCGQPLRLNYRLTGPLLVFLTVLLVFLVPHSRSLCGCTAESLPPSAPHAITSQALYARECSRPSAPPRSSRPSSCTVLPPSAPRAPHSRYSPPHSSRSSSRSPRSSSRSSRSSIFTLLLTLPPSHTPHHLPSVVRLRVLAPLAPPRSSRPSSCTALPPSAPRAPPHTPRAPPHTPRAPPHVPRAPPHVPRAPLSSLHYAPHHLPSVVRSRVLPPPRPSPFLAPLPLASPPPP